MPPKTIHIVDPVLVAKLCSVANKRGYGMLSVSQIVRIALGCWFRMKDQGAGRNSP